MKTKEDIIRVLLADDHAIVRTGLAAVLGFESGIAVGGLTNQDIATQFGITISGVKQHLNAIFAKLGASNRSEAVTLALKSQWIKP